MREDTKMIHEFRIFWGAKKGARGGESLLPTFFPLWLKGGALEWSVVFI